MQNMGRPLSNRHAEHIHTPENVEGIQQLHVSVNELRVPETLSN